MHTHLPAFFNVPFQDLHTTALHLPVQYQLALQHEHSMLIMVLLPC